MPSIPPKVFRFPGGDPAEPPIPDHVARVHRVYVGMDGVPVPSNELFLAMEPAAGQFAVFRRSDVKAFRTPKSTTITIQGFVPADEIDLKHYELSYDVSPDNRGEESYELFYLGLNDNGFCAIGEVPLFGRHRWVAIRPGVHGLVLYTLYYRDEVRLEDEYHIEFGRATKKGRQTIGALMRSQQCKFADVPLNNKDDQELLNAVMTKCESLVAGAGKTPWPGLPDNITEMLERSMEAVKRKQPRSEGPAPKPGKTGRPRGDRGR